MISPFENLPPELFRSILTYLSPEDTSALAQTCHRMHTITRDDDNLWRQYFLQRFKYSLRTLEYYNDEYSPNSALKSPEPPEGCTWREYFFQRSIRAKHIRSILNDVVSSRQNRIYNIELISSTYGLFALDVLQSYFPSSNNASTISLDSRHLTREYYSLEISRLISRETGLTLLRDLTNRGEVPTEGKALINALFAIQCFHPHGLFLSLNRLSLIGKQIIADPIFSTASVHEKSLLILTTMKKEKFLPANGERSYSDLENSFLYSAFHGKTTLPLTLVAIFCALAEECHLIARPIGFPGEVMAEVDSSSPESMPLIISVFESKLITLEQINDRFADLFDQPLTYPLPITPINELILRSARNIINSVTKNFTLPLSVYGLYAAVAVFLTVGREAFPFPLDSILNTLKHYFHMDVRFLETLSSLTSTSNDDLRRIRTEDSHPSPIEQKRRTDSSLKFSLGQIFQHRHHQYWGVICGWDLMYNASLVRYTRMVVPDLSRGKKQPFYHTLINGLTRQYVPEDDIDISAFTSIEDQEKKNSILRSLCSTDKIGKEFQSVDSVHGRFLPTAELRYEYPDDVL